MSPFLFLSIVDRIMRTKTSDRNIGIQWSLLAQLNDLDFADDLALISHLSQMQDKTRLVKTSAGKGLRSTEKNPPELIKRITSHSKPIGEDDSFIYLMIITLV